MFGLKKHKRNKRNTANSKLAKKILGKDSGRRVFGFACNPDIQTQLKILAGQLNVPLYALVEHALQLSADLITKIAENPEESALLRKHLAEIHVEMRTLEKICAYDEDMAKRLEEERIRHFAIDKAAHQIVNNFIRKGLSPNEIVWCINYGMRCRLAIANGKPIPKDNPPED